MQIFSTRTVSNLAWKRTKLQRWQDEAARGVAPGGLGSGLTAKLSPSAWTLEPTRHAGVTMRCLGSMVVRCTIDQLQLLPQVQF